MEKNIRSILYLVRTRSNNRNSILQLLNKTFPDYKIEFTNESFLLDWIWVHIFVSSIDNNIRIRIENSPNPFRVADVQLEIYQDIEGIPLMHPALIASLNFKE